MDKMGCTCNGTLANNTDFDTDLDTMMGNNVPKYLIQNNSQEESQLEIFHTQDQNKNAQSENEKEIIQDQIYKENETNQQIVENIIQLDQKIQNYDQLMIEKSLKSHFELFNLTQQAISFLIKNLVYCTQQSDQFIMEQGDQTTYFIIIHKGQAEIIINDKKVKVMSEGDYFGERTLSLNVIRSASIRTITDCNFWRLDRQIFQQAIELIMKIEYEENIQFINQISFFTFMQPQQKYIIIQQLITTKYEPGQMIVNEGEQADSFYLIKSGTVGVFKENKQINTMGPGYSFGVQALYEKITRGASVRAETEVKCLTIGRDKLTKILGSNIQLIIFNNIIRWSIEKSSILSQLTKIHREKISVNTHIENYKKGQVIFKKDTICDQLIIVLEGTLQCGDEKVEKGDCFGDQFLLQNKQNDLFLIDYQMITDGVLASISFTQIYKIIGGDFVTSLQMKSQSHEEKQKIPIIREDASHIHFEDLIYIDKIGYGQFAMIYLVSHKDQNKLYVLKCIPRSKIYEGKLQKHLLNEKMILEICNFPYINQLVKTYKDLKAVYFLLEYIKGFDLFYVIRQIGLLNKEQTQYYIGSIILCLEYLHSNGIAYRDLKPENVMVNTDGIVHLVDLGNAKLIKNSYEQKTFTILGTPHYMAPEIFAGGGHSYNADFWSLGVCCYEFLCGLLPYGENFDNPYEIYEDIINSELKFPKRFSDESARRYIEQLLSKQPALRLGTSYANLKSHPWFDDFNWDKLYNHELQPPYIPPKNKLINETKIETKVQEGKPIYKVIEESEQYKNIEQQIQQETNINWDQEF
ncbi:unnamed protein product [Paramecium pentaurelia]|uniref:cGMP-dependent protein kinase n=1 Tax=Paramecium pentaurelia TaxID=43138 RepID=A0A8S1S239_9CILI|nr:unnamed protein product [Paramecium pentaurelia]